MSATMTADLCPQPAMPDAEETAQFLFYCAMLHLHRGLGRFSIRAFADSPDDAGLDLLPLFRKAGRHHIELGAAADILNQVEGWLKNADFSDEAMAKAYARATVDFEEIDPVLQAARDADILAPDLANEPLPICALRVAPVVAQTMLEWHDNGYLNNAGWRDSLRKQAGLYFRAIETAQVQSEKNGFCRTFPYRDAPS